MNFAIKKQQEFDPMDIHPDVKAEILRRRDEVDVHPELLELVTEEWFEQMKSKLANARTAKRFAR